MRCLTANRNRAADGVLIRSGRRLLCNLIIFRDVYLLHPRRPRRYELTKTDFFRPSRPVKLHRDRN